MRWALNGSVAMNGREREGWEGVEGLQEGSKGLSYTDEWALASNHRVASLSNESEDATRKESTCKLIFTKRKGYPICKIFLFTRKWHSKNSNSSFSFFLSSSFFLQLINQKSYVNTKGIKSSSVTEE